MIITFFTDGISQITILMQNNIHKAFHHTIDLNQTEADIQSQIDDLIPPSTRRVLYNDTDFHAKHKAKKFKIMRMITSAVNKTNITINLAGKSDIQLVAIQLNKAIAYATSHIENIDQKSRYFFNYCMYHYDHFKSKK